MDSTLYHTPVSHPVLGKESAEQMHNGPLSHLLLSGRPHTHTHFPLGSPAAKSTASDREKYPLD